MARRWNLDEIIADGLKRRIVLGDKFRHKETHKIYVLRSFGDEQVTWKRKEEWHLVCEEDETEFKLQGRSEVARLFEDPRLASQRPQDWLADEI